MELTADQLMVIENAPVKLTVIGTFSDGSRLDITPGGSYAPTATLPAANISFTASPSSAVAFSTDPGYLKTISPGTVGITATDAVSKKRADVTFSIVTASAPQSSTFIWGGRVLSNVALRDATQFTLRLVWLASAENFTYLPWESSNPAVATIDRFGQLTAKIPGVTTISATVGAGYRTSQLITVVAPVDPQVVFGCEDQPTLTIKAQTWNTSLARDSSNVSEWAVVDSASCKDYARVDYLIDAGEGFVLPVFSAVRSSVLSGDASARFSPARLLSEPKLTAGSVHQLVATENADGSGKKKTFKVNVE